MTTDCQPDQDVASSLDALLKSRYGTVLSATDHFNSTIETMLRHRSIRGYADKRLAPNTLELLIAAAQSSSTSSNLQTWSVIAVEDAERKDRLARLSGDQQHIRACPLFLVWLADLARLDALGARLEHERDSLNYLEMLLVAVIDASLAAQNAAVAAESMGLGIVYIGGIRNYPEKVAAELNLPPRTFGVFGMCIGHPDSAQPTAIKPRLAQSAVLHREQYDPAAIDRSADAYIATMANFYREQGMKTMGAWDLHSLNRVRGADAMQGRDRLRAALEILGFAAR